MSWSAGASVKPYYLGGYSSARVRRGGNLTVLAASAAQAGGRLQATFTLLLPGSAAALAAQPLDVLSAASSLSETGALIPHRASQVRLLPCWVLGRYPALNPGVMGWQRSVAMGLHYTEGLLGARQHWDSCRVSFTCN